MFVELLSYRYKGTPKDRHLVLFWALFLARGNPTNGEGWLTPLELLPSHRQAPDQLLREQAQQREALGLLRGLDTHSVWSKRAGDSQGGYLAGLWRVEDVNGARLDTVGFGPPVQSETAFPSAPVSVGQGSIVPAGRERKEEAAISYLCMEQHSLSFHPNLCTPR